MLRRMIGYGVFTASILWLTAGSAFAANKDIQELQREIAARPAIVECLSVTGDHDYQLRIVARDLREFSDLLMHSIVPMPGVSTTRSSIVLEQIKSFAALPIPEE